MARLSWRLLAGAIPLEPRIAMPTVWNHFEGAFAVALRKEILVVTEQNVAQDGIPSRTGTMPPEMVRDYFQIGITVHDFGEHQARHGGCGLIGPAERPHEEMLMLRKLCNPHRSFRIDSKRFELEYPAPWDVEVASPHC